MRLLLTCYYVMDQSSIHPRTEYQNVIRFALSRYRIDHINLFTSIINLDEYISIYETFSKLTHIYIYILIFKQSFDKKLSYR